MPDPAPPVIGIPPFPERLARRYRLARRIALHRLLVRGRAAERRSIVLVSRHDLFPVDHGAAVKIVETARGLSRHGRDVFLVTHDRKHYWRVRDGVLEPLRLPRWLALLELREVILGRFGWWNLNLGAGLIARQIPPELCAASAPHRRPARWQPSSTEKPGSSILLTAPDGSD